MRSRRQPMAAFRTAKLLKIAATCSRRYAIKMFVAIITKSQVDLYFVENNLKIACFYIF